MLELVLQKMESLRQLESREHKYGGAKGTSGAGPKGEKKRGWFS